MGQMHHRAFSRGARPASWLPVMVLLACAPAAWSQAQPALPSLAADQVVQHLMEKNKERADTLQHYTGTRVYRLEYRGFSSSSPGGTEVGGDFDAPRSQTF